MTILSIILLIVVLILIGVTIYLFLQLNNSKRKIAEESGKYQQIESRLATLELESIRYKLNPHLFKNTLNAIQSHAYQTYYALDKLSNVLDFILYESERNRVPLKEEIEFALSLIEINRMKLSPLFDLRIKNKIDLDSITASEILIAPLITVDLIENAFKHSDLQQPDSFISIIFELKDGVFFLTVSNKVSGKLPLQKPKSGIGKENFQKRLELVYQKDFKLDQFVENDVYIAHLTIKLLESKNEMHTA